MKIRLGILDTDLNYMMRLSSYFNTYYSEKIELFAFSELKNLVGFLEASKLDVLLADLELMSDEFELPKFMELAYLVNSQDVETIKGVRTVCKYQRADLIYNEILNIYAELDISASYKMAVGNCPIYAFIGVTGGVGTTVVSAACAQNLADAGKKVLYLNLEENGVIDEFFEGEGNTTLSDALYAVKSNRSNLSLKLQSIVRKDQRGVYFYEPFDAILDANEMTLNDCTGILIL